MSLLNNAIGNVGSNPSNMTPNKRSSSHTSTFTATSSPSAESSSQATNTQGTSQSVSSGLSYSATGQILISKGQIVRGEITDIRNNTVSIKVDLGDTITYPLQGDPELTIGQMATFKAVETDDGIALRALSAKPSQARLATINKALEEAGLQKNERNQSIVYELLKNQMSIDRQTIQKIFQQSLVNKNASISTLVLMNKHMIPITNESSTQFENYRNHEHRISKEVSTIADQVPQLLDRVSTFTSSKNFLAINNELMNILLDKNPSTELPFHEIMSSKKDVIQLIDILRPFALTDELEDSIFNKTATLRDVVTCIQESISRAEEMEQDIKQQNAIAPKQTTEAMQNEIIKTTESTTSTAKSMTAVFQTPIIRKILEHYTEQQFNKNELSTFLSLQNRQTLNLALDKFYLPASLHEKILSGNLSTNDLLHAITNALEVTNATDAKTLYSSKVFQWVLKEHIRSTMSLSTDDIAQNKVNDYYDGTFSKLNELKNFLQNSGLSQAFVDLSTNIRNITDNMEFMKTLNTLFPYVQLPLKLKDKFIHSDLYVFTNKKKLMQQQDSIRVLLHLNMENLGSTDIHITLTRGNVDVKFYLQDDLSTSLLKNNIDRLEESLGHSGYLLHTEFLQREKDIDIVSDIIEKDQVTTSLKRYSFDIRA